MKHLIIAAAAAALLAGAAQAQPKGPGRDFDTDRDGKVTLAEYKAATAERTARMFTRLDANKDGKVTAAEMQAARPPKDGAAPQPGRGGGMLKRMDGNGDGAVTRAEMDAAGAARFAVADTNHDGWLSKGEVIQMRQRMGGPPTN